MAGDWIKVRVDLFTSPKVVRISSALKADRLRTVGGLLSAWCLFDAHSADGRLDGYTPEVLDDLVGLPGLCAAMESVGWLVIDGESLVMARFDEHNGQSAKRRAMDADRKKNVRKMSASDADKMRTREEKRREELTTSSLRSEVVAHSDAQQETKPAKNKAVDRPDDVSESVWTDYLAIRKAKRAPMTGTALDGLRKEAGKAGLSLQDALRVCCAKGWQGFDASWIAGRAGGQSRRDKDAAWLDELLGRNSSSRTIEVNP